MQGRTGFQSGGYPPSFRFSLDLAQVPTPIAQVLTGASSGSHRADFLRWESRGDFPRLPGKRFLGVRTPLCKGGLPQALHVTIGPWGRLARTPRQRRALPRAHNAEHWLRGQLKA
jgi:hypothetical protein